MTQAQQPSPTNSITALVLANALAFCDSSVAAQAATELRSQYSRLLALEAENFMLKDMRSTQCLHQIAEPVPQAQDVQRDAALLDRLAQWCDDQAASDWYGRKASDMVRLFAKQRAAGAAQGEGA